MYLNAEELDHGKIINDYDICIIGAGAAGISLATKLHGSTKKVLLLDSGISSDRGYNPTGGRQRLYEGTLGDFMSKVDPVFMTRSRLRMYGGTTNHIEFFTTPLTAPDFVARPGYRDTLWPFGVEEINPYYEEANHFGRFGPFNYDDIDFWAKVQDGRPINPEPEDKLENWIFHAQFDNDIHDFQVQCGDLLKNSQNITVLFNANALELESDVNKSHVSRIRCGTIENEVKGREFFIALGEKGKCVLSMGGIESTRLLQLSDDLGDNQKNMLGKGFMLHPVIVEGARVRFDKCVDPAITRFYNRQDVCLRKSGDLYNGIPLRDSAPEDYNFMSWGVLIPKTEMLYKDQIGNFRIWINFTNDRKCALLGYNWEQLPNEASTLTLDSNKVDPVFGQPVSHLDWHLMDKDKETVQKCQEYCIDFFTRHGAASVEIITDLSGGAEDWLFTPKPGCLKPGDHHMGTIRMSESPCDGIVDADCKIHNVDNVYVSSSAIFPAVGYANPTMAIVALSLRLGDHLKSL